MKSAELINYIYGLRESVYTDEIDPVTKTIKHISVRQHNLTWPEVTTNIKTITVEREQKLWTRCSFCEQDKPYVSGKPKKIEVKEYDMRTGNTKIRLEYIYGCGECCP